MDLTPMFFLNKAWVFALAYYWYAKRRDDAQKAAKERSDQAEKKAMEERIRIMENRQAAQDTKIEVLCTKFDGLVDTIKAQGESNRESFSRIEKRLDKMQAK